MILVLDDDSDRPHVTVLPITHAPPADAMDSIEIPLRTKQRLGLDEERSWIIITEANDFYWPGPDLRPIPGSDPSTVVYGMLPPALFEVVRARVIARVRAGHKLSRIGRTE